VVFLGAGLTKTLQPNQDFVKVQEVAEVCFKVLAWGGAFSLANSGNCGWNATVGRSSGVATLPVFVFYASNGTIALSASTRTPQGHDYFGQILDTDGTVLALPSTSGAGARSNSLL